MATIPIPKSVKKGVKMLFSGSAFDIAWKIGIGLLFLWLIYFLAQIGIVGGIIAGVIFGSLLSPTVQSIVYDVWNRNFITV